MAPLHPDDQETLPLSHDGDGDGDSEADAVLRAIAHAPPRLPHSTVVPGMRWGESDRYIIERRLGRGGMGTVYAATDSVLGRVVALKVLDAAGAGQDAGHHVRLLREAQLAARVEHERIARVYDVGTHDGFAFVAMEYVQGGTLRQWASGHDVTLAEVVDVAVQIAEGLAELHAKGVVHRDLKPENVMMTKQGGVKLLDFGLARYTVRHAEEADAPGQEAVLNGASIAAASGTPGYMAPEQYEGQPIDARVDIFALGVILHELITGDRLFPGATIGTIMQATLDWAPVLRGGSWERIPEPLRDHIARMLARDPSARFPEGGSVLAALRELEIEPSPRRARLPAATAQMIESAPPQRALPRRLAGRLRSGFAARAVEIGCAIAAVIMFIVQRPEPRPSAPPPPGMVRIDVGTIAVGRDLSEIERECREIGRGCDKKQMLREVPRSKVTVAPFFLDRDEVTNEQFAEMLNTLRGTLSVSDDDEDHTPRFVHRNTGTGTPEALFDLRPKFAGIEHLAGPGYRPVKGKAQLPVSVVSWYGAKLYCEAHGKRLPTEDEWEAAARGHDDRRFPWGNSMPGCAGVGVPDDGELGLPSPCPAAAVARAVGSAIQDVTPEGVRDLGGNLAEWTSSLYVEGNRAAHLKSSSPATPRVVRGGSWGESLMARSSGRRGVSPSIMGQNLGFRCASNADDAQP
jgi:formylglycine-generating enzyme required for sulfatase activity/predicted Ser/Thr protein kinase